MALKLPKIGGLGTQRQVPYDPTNPWDPENIKLDFARRDAEFTREDGRNLKRDQDIELQPGARLILRSLNGKRWAVLVDNAGVLSTVEIL
jgi:hypothetical protein